MNFEYFIARRIAAHKDYKSSISAPIIKIAILAISLGMITMLISVATSVGLQKKIKEKVSAFNGDLIITNFDTNNSDDSQVPISMQQAFYPNFTISDNVSHIQITASKGAVIRTETDFEGVIVKGVGPDYNWSYFEDFLTQGVLPTYTAPQMSNQVLISEYLANRLGLKVGDKALAYFFNKNSTSDIFLSSEISHDFVSTDRKFQISPTMGVFLGSQNFYKEYYVYNRFGSERSTGSGQGSGQGTGSTADPIETTTTTVVLEESEKFDLMAVEFSIPIWYMAKPFTVSFLPVLVVPQNPATLTVDSAIYEEDLENTFYWMVGLSYRF